MQFCCASGRDNWYGDDELSDLLSPHGIDGRLHRSACSHAIVDENNGFAPKVHKLPSTAVELLPMSDLPALTRGRAAQIILRNTRG